jgi:hypothetical protein
MSRYLGVGVCVCVVRVRVRVRRVCVCVCVVCVCTCVRACLGQGVRLPPNATPHTHALTPNEHPAVEETCRTTRWIPW